MLCVVKGRPGCSRFMIRRHNMACVPSTRVPSSGDGSTALVLACERGHEAAASILLDAGADPNGAGEQMPLACSATGGHLPVVRLLLKNHASPDAFKTDKQVTPLMIAARIGLLCFSAQPAHAFVLEACDEALCGAPTRAEGSLRRSAEDNERAGRYTLVQKALCGALRRYAL